ncbi:TVP38/TMEM64 family protein [Desulfobacula sp.]
MTIFLLTALSVPGITTIIVAGGAIFGFPLTLLITSFADTFGSTTAFLASRYLFGNRLQVRYNDRLQVINKGVDQEGAFYLFSLRLMPFFPCFLINLLMGVTSIRITTFYWVTQGGKLPFTAIYVNAGTQFGNLDSVFDIFSPGIILSFALIGLFPLIAKKSLQRFKAHKKIK